MSRHALITGAGTGIGEAISRQLHREGHAVTLVGRRSEPLEALSQALGKQSFAVTGDVTDRGEIESAFKAATAQFGDVEILVNCAGMAPTAPFHRVDFADWQRTMDVNVNGVFHCTQLALESMLENNWGRVVNIASVASLRGFPYVSGYCASKHAVLGMTRALALEVATQGITVNAVAPGYVETDMVRAVPEKVLEKIIATIPVGRLGKAEDIAHAVMYLVDEDASFITGSTISINGGQHMY